MSKTNDRITWHASVGVDRRERLRLQVFKLNPFRLIRKAEFLEDDEHLGWVRDLV